MDNIPITMQSPDSPLNIINANYQVAQPTPEAAIFDGMYCRGGACQYRTGAPPPTISPTPPVPIIYPNSNREFCRGVSCTPGMGVPENPVLNKFVFDCSHLYQDVGKVAGTPGSRTIADAKESFYSWCKTRFPPPLIGNCEGLGDVIVMAMHARANSANIGGAKEICTDLFLFLGGMNQAKVDLKLMPGAFPQPPAFVMKATRLAKVFLPSNLDEDVGPHTARGKAWLLELKKLHKLGTVSLYGPGVTAARPVFKPGDASLLATKTKLDPPHTPDYTQAPACVHGVVKGAYKYQIDQNVPPTEVDGPLYEFCTNEMSEIMGGFAQTGDMVTTMAKDWCNWQSSVTSWVGEADQTGHPEWDFRRCNQMSSFLAFAVHNDLNTGLGAADVCNRVFLVMGAMDWHQGQIDNAWALGPARVIDAPGLTSAVDDEAAKKLMKAAQDYANTMYSKLRGQKEMYNDLNSAKMDTAAFSLHAKSKLRPKKPPPPPLPNDTFAELDA